MTALREDERRELVELLRAVSPEGMRIPAPRLRPELEALVGAALPRHPRAVLFDVYGTLIASAAGGEPNRAGARREEGERARAMLERVLWSEGFEGGAGAFEEEVSRLIESTRRDAMERTPNPEVDIALLVSASAPRASPASARRLAILLEASLNPCAAMPGAGRLLKRLRGGPRLGIVSNAQFYTPLLIEATLGEEPDRLGFETDLCAYSYEGGVAKPDPEIFLRAAGKLLGEGMAPGDILVVGNSSANDIAPAVALGFMTVLFAGDARSFRPSPPGSPLPLPSSILVDFDGFEAVLPA